MKYDSRSTKRSAPAAARSRVLMRQPEIREFLLGFALDGPNLPGVAVVAGTFTR